MQFLSMLLCIITNLIKFLLIGTAGIFIFSFVFLIKNTYLPRYTVITTPLYYGIHYETVQFFSTDGVKLTGWFIPSKKENPLILMCHGLGTSKSDILDISISLHKAGYNLLLFDFRGHGESEGRATSFGYLEQYDVKGALDYLDSRQDISHNGYGVFGPSMGGAAACIVATEDMRIKALIIDSIYADLGESMIRHTKLLYNFPRIPFGFFVLAAYNLRFITNISRISPVKEIGKVSPRPIFIINGEKDERMPASDAKRLYEASGEPKELWIIPDAIHFGGYWINTEEYETKILNFFNKYLPIIS